MVKKDTKFGINIKHIRKIFEELPYLNKTTLSSAIEKEGESLNYWVKRLSRTGELVSLKNGLFTTETFLLKLKGQPALLNEYQEFIANVIRAPSYVSLEYVMAKYDIIPDIPFCVTSITTKSSRKFTNPLGGFIYKNIKRPLFTGYVENSFLDKRYFIATPAKALFDFLYLKNLGRANFEEELTEGLRINWNAFQKTDTEELKKYVVLSKQRKMETIMNIIEKRNLI
jgi:hypothetical protein